MPSDSLVSRVYVKQHRGRDYERRGEYTLVVEYEGSSLIDAQCAFAQCKKRIEEVKADDSWRCDWADEPTVEIHWCDGTGWSWCESGKPATWQALMKACAHTIPRGSAKGKSVAELRLENETLRAELRSVEAKWNEARCDLKYHQTRIHYENQELKRVWGVCKAKDEVTEKLQNALSALKRVREGEEVLDTMRERRLRRRKS